MPTQNVVVDVTNGQTTVDKHTVTISIKDGDEVVWHTHQNEPFAVAFPGGGPFPSSLFIGMKGKPVHSKAAAVTEAGRDYKYEVQVLGSALLDPVVHTDS